ncbi:MAG: hypothetical protein NPIRA02_00110 [Nitrospirales bacterium]|nr:MAG: hypothetical protein NPIRA02_00110 [Nitrospirales bacterium]
MAGRITSVLIIGTIGGMLSLVPISGFAGSAQDAFKKLQGQNGSEIKAQSSRSSAKTAGKNGQVKEKAQKAMKDAMNKESKKMRN